MGIQITSVLLLLCVDFGLSQYDVYMRSNPRSNPYHSTRDEIVSNFLGNKPLIDYVPMYNTEYEQWSDNAEKFQKMEPVKNEPVSYPETKPKTSSDIDFQKLAEVVTRLKADMQTLSHQTRHAYEDKLKELDEVKKLNEDLKIALHNTDILKNSLHEQEKQLSELEKNIQGRSESDAVNPGIEEFLNMIESLELMVRNISNKYGGKLGN